MQAIKFRIFRLAFWLIGIRWCAILCVIIAVLIAKYFFHLSMQEKAIYSIVLILVILNITYYFLWKYIQKSVIKRKLRTANRLINVNISIDWVVLTILLHYSGGVENPFIIYYILHMIIGSIILSTRASIFQTSFALLLVGALSALEYTGILEHFPLAGVIATNIYNNLTYLCFTGFIFITTSYFVVYITRTIVRESLKNEVAYLRANLKLKQRDKIKNEYVVQITHDIKGHITAIHGIISVLKKKILGPLNPRQDEFVERASNRIGVLNAFISDLLSLTQCRLQQKRNMASFDLAGSVEKVIKLVETSAQEKDVTIELRNYLSSAGIYGEQSLIEEVMLNLLQNAIKYSRPGKTVYITLEDRKEQILIEVEDHGIGIPVDEIDLVFNEFYRASNARLLVKEGTGLGLAISKHIIENHKGRIWVNSIPGAGTTFSVLLNKEILP